MTINGISRNVEIASDFNPDVFLSNGTIYGQNAYLLSMYDYLLIDKKDFLNYKFSYEGKDLFATVYFGEKGEVRFRIGKILA